MDGKRGADNILEEGLQSLGQFDPAVEALLRRRPDTKDLLNAYIDESERFNPAYGLISAKDREELVIRHILDSLSPLGIIARLCAEWNGTRALDNGGGGGGNAHALDTAHGGDNTHAFDNATAGGNAHALDNGGNGGNTHALDNATAGGNAHALDNARSGGDGNARLFNIADAGSGAGLPGIPLAIVLREASFSLVERMGRRAGFLRGALAVLGLSNVTVREEEMEKMARRAPACFNLIVFRAFKPLEGSVLKGLLALLEPGGSLAAWKGRRDKIAAEMAAAERSGIGPGAWEAVPLHVPFLDEERHLVLIRRKTG
jgi:16S rRNA (guanine527-N7)-methyltransferase